MKKIILHKKEEHVCTCEDCHCENDGVESGESEACCSKNKYKKVTQEERKIQDIARSLEVCMPCNTCSEKKLKFFTQNGHLVKSVCSKCGDVRDLLHPRNTDTYLWSEKMHPT